MIHRIISTSQVPAEFISSILVQPPIEEKVVQVLVEPAFGTNEVVGFASNLPETEFPPVVPFPFAVQARDVDGINNPSEIVVQSPGLEDGAPELLPLLNEAEISTIKANVAGGKNLAETRKIYEYGMDRAKFQRDVDELFGDIRLKEVVNSYSSGPCFLWASISNAGITTLRDAIIMTRSEWPQQLSFLKESTVGHALRTLGVTQEGTKDTQNERFYLSPTKNNKQVKLVDIDYETAKADIIHFKNELAHMAEIVSRIPPPLQSAAIA